MKLGRRIESWLAAGAAGLLCVCLAWLIAAGPAPAAKDPAVGRIFGVEGKVEVLNPPAKKKAPAAKGMALVVHDEVHTGADSGAKLVLKDDSLLRVGPETVCKLDKFALNPDKGEREAKIGLPQGTLKVLVNDLFEYRQRMFEIETPTAVAGVRGTRLVIVVESDESTVVLSLDNPLEVINKLLPNQPVYMQGVKITRISGDNPLHLVENAIQHPIELQCAADGSRGCSQGLGQFPLLTFSPKKTAVLYGDRHLTRQGSQQRQLVTERSRAQTVQDQHAQHVIVQDQWQPGE